ncbi:hypothetical protein EJ06DRAFT_518162 [Trichodelitschia bisporula]|uniref:Uncharacterized protein n=1 Tax=Trichodelitschia bisporula TaxID=703511 RepID=A0A6G1IAP6_9PEZI|nr:hypothetical protein EJ06DRAFT_518162 [Trichodelitschia bisporula]
MRETLRKTPPGPGLRGTPPSSTKRTASSSTKRTASSRSASTPSRPQAVSGSGPISTTTAATKTAVPSSVTSSAPSASGIGKRSSIYGGPPLPLPVAAASAVLKSSPSSASSRGLNRSASRAQAGSLARPTRNPTVLQGREPKRLSLLADQPSQISFQAPSQVSSQVSSGSSNATDQSGPKPARRPTVRFQGREPRPLRLSRVLNQPTIPEALVSPVASEWQGAQSDFRPVSPVVEEHDSSRDSSIELKARIDTVDVNLMPHPMNPTPPRSTPPRRQPSRRMDPGFEMAPLSHQIPPYPTNSSNPSASYPTPQKLSTSTPTADIFSNPSLPDTSLTPLPRLFSPWRQLSTWKKLTAIYTAAPPSDAALFALIARSWLADMRTIYAAAPPADAAIVIAKVRRWLAARKVAALRNSKALAHGAEERTWPVTPSQPPARAPEDTLRHSTFVPGTMLHRNTLRQFSSATMPPTSPTPHVAPRPLVRAASLPMSPQPTHTRLGNTGLQTPEPIVVKHRKDTAGQSDITAFSDIMHAGMGEYASPATPTPAMRAFRPAPLNLRPKAVARSYAPAPPSSVYSQPTGGLETPYGNSLVMPEQPSGGSVVSAAESTYVPVRKGWKATQRGGVNEDDGHLMEEWVHGGLFASIGAKGQGVSSR